MTGQQILSALIPALLLINMVSLVLMGRDKRKAQRHDRRIPEKVFFGLALCGGAVGIWAGMGLFRHKTRHPAFLWGIPAILLIQLIMAFLLSTVF